MRRATEWLLLPLFLLPIGVAIALHLWAGRAYDDELADYSAEGAVRAEAWLAKGGPAHGLIRSFALQGAQLRTAASPRRGLRVELGPWSGQVSIGGSRAYGQLAPTWRLSETYPAGLAPRALADPQLRLAVETGQPHALVAGLDPASRAFCELLGSPEMRRLAAVPLPAATKLYLVRRWRSQGVTVPQLALIEEVLVFLARLEPLLVGRTQPFAVGVHVQDGILVLSRLAREPIFAPWRESPLATVDQLTWFDATDGADGLVTLRYLGGAAAPPAEGLLWQGRLAAPLAGAWAFTRRFGPQWWSVPRYRRWIGPIGALLLAFLLIPTALLVSLRRRRRLDEARSRFLNELAHDLRTPLTSLRLYAEMLARKPTGDSVQDRSVKVMTRESVRVSALLGSLLDLSRLEDGRRHLESQDVELGALVAQAAHDFEVLYPTRAKDLEVAGPMGVNVRADPAALARCLANLLENAGKYTAAGTPVQITWARDDHQIRIHVRDEGPGIPPSERRAAFERYTRGARARRDGLPGTGLGLALVKELAVEMQGSVRLVPSNGGTEIEMRLPAATQ